MPMEIALLPMIESAFISTALSPSAASGIWQFIPSTGRYYGLRQDTWYDGRLQDIIYFEKQDPKIKRMICSVLAGYAWDASNPFAAQSEGRFSSLYELCRA